MNLRTLLLGPLGLLITGGLLTAGAGRAGGDDSPWRYGRHAGVEYVYDVTLEVNVRGEETRYQGLTHYRIEALNDTQLQITYRGRVQEQPRRPDPEPQRRGLIPPPPRLPPFFTGTAMSGTVEQTNRLTLTRSGEVLASQGDSQLPFLLGNASVLPLEQLPSSAAHGETWSTESTISISEASQPDRFGHPMRPTAGQKSTQVARQEVRYELLEQNVQGAKIKKTLRLSSPEVAGHRSYEMSGEGTWEFDFESGMPQAGDFSLVLKLAETNIEATVPIRVQYRRLSSDELLKREEESQRQAERVAAASAERARQASLPLTAAEKAAALQGLRSSRNFDQHRALTQLSQKKPADPDPELLQIVAQLSSSPDRAVAMQAERVLTNWSPAYATWSKINKAYREGGRVTATDRLVGPRTPLVAGQLVIYRRHMASHIWTPAEVVDTLADSSVLLRPTGNRDVRAVAVPRAQIQLAPDEVDQPGRPGAGNPLAGLLAGTPANRTNRATSTTAGGTDGAAGNTDNPMTDSPVRTWTDVSGQHRIEAALLDADEQQVRLRRTDGKEISVPLEKLSEADREHARRYRATSRQRRPPNPFE